MTAAGRQRLRTHAWPGNVRELLHELERAVVFEESEELNFAHLGDSARTASAATDPSDWFNSTFAFPAQGFSLEEAINRLIHHALKQTDNTFRRRRVCWVCRAIIFVTVWRDRNSLSPLGSDTHH